MKTMKIFLCLAGIFLAMLSSAAFAVDDNILRQGLAGEIVVQPVNGKIDETPEAVASGGDILASNLSGETEVPKPALPPKGLWAKLDKGETISGVAYLFCEKKNRATVESILQANHLTWEDASKLPVGYDFFISSELLSKEYQNPLGKIVNLQEQVDEFDNKLEELSKELNEERFAYNDLQEGYNKFVSEVRIAKAEQQETITELQESNKGLHVELDTLRTDKTQVEQNLTEARKKSKQYLWIIVLLGVVAIALGIWLGSALNKNSSLTKENTRLRGYMRSGRLNFHFSDGDEFAFYCSVSDKGQYNISPFNMNGETLINRKEMAHATVRSAIKRHFNGGDEVVAEVETTLKSGQLVQLVRVEHVEPEVIESEAQAASETETAKA